MAGFGLNAFQLRFPFYEGEGESVGVDADGNRLYPIFHYYDMDRPPWRHGYPTNDFRNLSRDDWGIWRNNEEEQEPAAPDIPVVTDWVSATRAEEEHKQWIDLKLSNIVDYPAGAMRLVSNQYARRMQREQHSSRAIREVIHGRYRDQRIRSIVNELQTWMNSVVQQLQAHPGPNQSIFSARVIRHLYQRIGEVLQDDRFRRESPYIRERNEMGTFLRAIRQTLGFVNHSYREVVTIPTRFME